MSTGFLFDIQRFGLHDGPGIRTVVFFKGCPLHCRWCHNPESQTRQMQIRFRPEACVLCGECAPVCAHEAHQVSESGHHYDRERCTACGSCTSECLFEAIQQTGRAYSVAEVMAVVLRDCTYYATSGGGLTLTGGEPLAQPDFCCELLAAARSEGIHTCVETSGYAPHRILERILPLVDLFLYDYKATGTEQYKALTGVGSSLILQNLAFLLEKEASVWLRCPLVPGVNDTPQHLQGIADLERLFPQLQRIDLLPYHNIGNSKYSDYGLVNPLPYLPTTPEATQQTWLADLRMLGSQKARVG
jgi:pyruvate formate lyase activating enzyme